MSSWKCRESDKLIVHYHRNTCQEGSVWKTALVRARRLLLLNNCSPCLQHVLTQLSPAGGGVPLYLSHSLTDWTRIRWVITLSIEPVNFEVVPHFLFSFSSSFLPAEDVPTETLIRLVIRYKVSLNSMGPMLSTFSPFSLLPKKFAPEIREFLPFFLRPVPFCFRVFLFPFLFITFTFTFASQIHTRFWEIPRTDSVLRSWRRWDFTVHHIHAKTYCLHLPVKTKRRKETRGY